MTATETGLGTLLSRHHVLDLSLLIAEDLPCSWSTHLPFQHKTWNWFATERRPSGDVYSRGGPYATRWLALDEHTGTHFDAPSHFIPPPESGLPDAGPAGAITASDVPPDQLMGAAAVLDVSAVTGTENGVSPLLEPAVVLDWERANGRLRPGDVVLFHTGWDRRYQADPDAAGYLGDVVVTRTSPGWPAPEEATIDLLVERGVRCVGIDAPSIGAAHDPRPAHVAGLRAGLVFVECLTGLAAVPPRGAWFCFLPIRVRGGTGAPGRAIALVPRDRPDYPAGQ